MVALSQHEMVEGMGLWGVPSYRLSGPDGEPDLEVWGKTVYGWSPPRLNAAPPPIIKLEVATLHHAFFDNLCGRVAKAFISGAGLPSQ